MAEDVGSAEWLELQLSASQFEVAPGSSPLELTVVVRNTSPVVEQCTIEVVGLDPDWFTHPTRSVALFPGDSDRLTIAFHVPATDGLRAGSYPFGVVARSRASGIERRAEGLLVIPGTAAYEMDIAPRRVLTGKRGQFRVLLTNSGTADGELQLEATDAEEGVAFLFPRDNRARVPARRTVEVPLVAVPRRRPWVGPDHPYEVKVSARRPGDPTELRSVTAQLVHHPRFASLSLLRRLAMLAGLVVALLAVLTVLPADLRCRLVSENVAVPLLGRGCGVGELAVSPGAAPSALPVPAAPAAAKPPVTAPGVVSAGGGGAATGSPSPAADQVAAAIGGGGGDVGTGMTIEGMPTPVPPAATAAAVFMAGVDATQQAAATAVAAATPRPPTLVVGAVSATATVAATPTPTVRVVAAQVQAGACSPTQQPPATPTPTRAAAVGKPSPQATATPARPVNDWALSDPTAWWYCFGVTADQLTQFLKTNQARLVDIEVEQAQPTVLFSAVAVANQGRYARAWWWYFGLDDVQVQERLTANTARPIALKGYEAGGQKRFAVVMVSNKAPDNKTFWWFPDLDMPQQIVHLLQTNKARLADVDPYVAQGQREYAAVMIANAGADQANSTFLDNVTTDQISAEVARINGHVIDIEPNEVARGTFDAIIEACPCAKNWWAAGLDDAGLASTLAQTGGRITSMATYAVNGQRRFAVTLIDNT